MKRLFLLPALLLTYITSIAQLNIELLGQLSYDEELSDVWGYVDEVGNEYALVGLYNGFSVVDVTDPQNPEEVYFESGPNSIWRDIKTWGDYAYISNETADGILIVDLSPLPYLPITTSTNFTGDTYPFSTSHNLYIDESGKMYIFGANSGSGGAIICDVATDPMNPVEMGRFNDFYLHDGMARGDTLWGAGIYQGVLAAIDVSNPGSTSIMGTVSTPGQFAHNAWVSDDGTHVFTTDEISSGYLGAYNVTDLSNMFETDRVQSSPGSGVIPHNVHVRNDFLVTSYYTDGLVIHDAANPNNVTLVGQYDTSPNYSGSGFNGCWGAYPFLPSGNILASDIEEGLFILGFNFTRASFVEGVVKDSITGDPLFNVTIEVLGTDIVTQTIFDGTFDISAILNGEYDLRFSKSLYEDKIIENVAFIQGEITELEVELAEVEIFVSTDDLTSDNSFTVFPNPSSGAFVIQSGTNTENRNDVSISITNTGGQKILERAKVMLPANGTQFGYDLAPGIYLLEVFDGNEIIYTQKIIKQ
jgi:choice-of-anchor B domain-containing protein